MIDRIPSYVFPSLQFQGFCIICAPYMAVIRRDLFPTTRSAVTAITIKYGTDVTGDYFGTRAREWRQVVLRINTENKCVDGQVIAHNATDLEERIKASLHPYFSLVELMNKGVEMSENEVQQKYNVPRTGGRMRIG